MKISETKKAAGKHCAAYHCKGDPVAKKGGLCHKHYARLLRDRDPVQVRYSQFVVNARNRNKEVYITLEEFRDWCNETGYIVQKGRRGRAATIDRIINSEGYRRDNMQILSNRANASKGCRDNYPF